MAFLGTRALTLKIGGTDRTDTITNCRLTAAAADSDTVTFADAAAGGARQYNLAFTGKQDPATGSLWDQVWTVPGTSVAAILAPNGGPASATAPTFTGQVVVTEPDGDLLGGEANISTTARFTFDCEWPFLAKPVRAFS